MCTIDTDIQQFRGRYNLYNNINKPGKYDITIWFFRLIPKITAHKTCKYDADKKRDEPRAEEVMTSA